MNMVFYTILFILGCTIGCIWREKTEKFPRDLDLKKTHFSNKSNQELISKLIYMLIGGISFVILANILNLNMKEIDVGKLIIYFFSILYISVLVIVAGIDRNYSKIEKRVLSFGIISSIIYMLYLCCIDITNVYLWIIYLVIYIILLVIDNFLLKKYAKDSYIINILLLLTIIYVFTDLKLLIYTLTMALIACFFQMIFIKSQQKKNMVNDMKIREIPLGFFIGASNIIVLFITRIFENYCI